MSVIAPIPESQKQQVNASCISFLVMEMVPLSLRMTAEFNNTSTTVSGQKSDSEGDDQNQGEFHYGGVEALNNFQMLRNENNAERISRYGESVGAALLEVIIFEKEEQQQPPQDLKVLLNVMKLIARDVWKSLYIKQMDNLRTNHRGTFILVDSKHKLISKFDPNTKDISKQDVINLYLKFDCGVITGLLRQCSLQSSVDAEYKPDRSVHYTIIVQQQQQQ